MTDTAPGDFNSKVIAEFRANGGLVGGPFEGAPVILLHHVGSRSGTERVNPLVYQRLDGGDVAIFASYAGADADPAWYRNLMASPDTTVEVGTETYPVHVRQAQGAERDAIWERQKELSPGFAEYEVKAAPRVIPVLVLERR